MKLENATLFLMLDRKKLSDLLSYYVRIMHDDLSDDLGLESTPVLTIRNLEETFVVRSGVVGKIYSKDGSSEYKIEYEFAPGLPHYWCKFTFWYQDPTCDDLEREYYAHYMAPMDDFGDNIEVSIRTSLETFLQTVKSFRVSLETVYIDDLKTQVSTGKQARFIVMVLFFGTLMPSIELSVDTEMVSFSVHLKFSDEGMKIKQVDGEFVFETLEKAVAFMKEYA